MFERNYRLSTFKLSVSTHFDKMVLLLPDYKLSAKVENLILSNNLIIVEPVAIVAIAFQRDSFLRNQLFSVLKCLIYQYFFNGFWTESIHR